MKSGPPMCFGCYFPFYFRRCWLLPFCFRYSPVRGRIAVLVEALLYIQQPPPGSKASLSSQMTVTDVERPSLLQSASRRVLSIVTDNPVNCLQAVWMPRLRSVLARAHWFLLRSFLFSSPTPRATLVTSGCRFTSPLMVQERCALALPSCGERVSTMYFWILTHHCVQVPLLVKNTNCCCSSCCLDPAVVTVTAVELEGVSYKFVSILGTLLLPGSGQALSCSGYSITCARLA